MLKFKEIQIFNGTLNLYERTVLDVQKLDLTMRSVKDITPDMNISFHAVIIRDSIKHNLDNWTFKKRIFDFRKYFKLKKILDLQYILSQLSVRELKQFVDEINELEGVVDKKKVESESVTEL